MTRTDAIGRCRSFVLYKSLAVACLLSLAFGCQPAKPAPVRKPLTVTVTPATILDVPRNLSRNSTTRAVEEVTIRARVKGFLKQTLFKEGSDVKKGDLLFVIDEDPYKVTLAQAKGMLAEAKAGLEKAKQAMSREIATAQLALSMASQLYEKVQDQRTRTLYTRNAATKGDLDLADAQIQKANAQVDADRAQLAQTNADYQVNILAAEAKVAQAQASVDDAQINLGYCRMYAPLNGRIGEALVKRDNLVGSANGETPLATIQQLDPISVALYAPSRSLPLATALLPTGLEMEIDLGQERPKRYKGRVDFIDNTVGQSTGQFLLKAKVPNPDKSILPGEYARWYVTIETRKNAIAIPERAIKQTQAGPTVYVVENGKVVSVRVVLDTDPYRGVVVVMSGLTAGQKVIVEGLQLVRPGSDSALELKEKPLTLLDEPGSEISPGSVSAADASGVEDKPKTPDRR